MRLLDWMVYVLIVRPLDWTQAVGATGLLMNSEPRGSSYRTQLDNRGLNLKDTDAWTLQPRQLMPRCKEACIDCVANQFSKTCKRPMPEKDKVAERRFSVVGTRVQARCGWLIFVLVNRIHLGGEPKWPSRLDSQHQLFVCIIAQTVVVWLEAVAVRKVKQLQACCDIGHVCYVCC